jgi:hypothetical protein
MPELPESKVFSIGEKQFSFALATTAMQLITGLAGVASLEPLDGMLFDFGMNWPVIMTPKGLVFPVEVAFIDEDGVINEIKTLDPTDGFTQAATKKARFALEVPVGFFEENEITVGNILEF